MPARWDAVTARIDAREAVIGVVGLGYVGLSAAIAFAEAGFRVLGVDLDRERVAAVKGGRSFFRDVVDERVAAARRSGRLVAGTSYRRLKDADVVLLCLPTPLTDGTPDLSSLVASAHALAKVLKPASLVVLESTSYPGTTEEVLLPALESSGLFVGRDFLLAYSPERIDPGNPIYGLGEIPKVVGGIDPPSTKAAARLYEHVVPKVVTVSGTKEAELAKLIENTFRHVNIALVNELAVYAHEMGVDIWEAIEAAATKPFGFLPFWPGPGWGGHCIPLDPAYLSWRIRRDSSNDVRFVELADAVNAEMPRYVVERATRLLNDRGKPLRGSLIVGLGAAYKGGTEDTRGSPGLKVLGMLAMQGAEVSYHDPLVPEAPVAGRALRSVPLEPTTLRRADLVIVFVPQVGVDWRLVGADAPLVLDCCNALRTRDEKVVRL